MYYCVYIEALSLPRVFRAVGARLSDTHTWKNKEITVKFFHMNQNVAFSVKIISTYSMKCDKMIIKSMKKIPNKKHSMFTLLLSFFYSPWFTD